MRGTNKRFMVSIGCAGIVLALLLTAILTTHLLANREMVRSFLVNKTAQVTGGALDYDRLDISFLPLPHLTAREVHLRRPDAFEGHAQELSVYPRILPILKGQVSIRRLVLVTPDFKILVGSDPIKTPDSPKIIVDDSLEGGIRTAIGGIFGALAAIDPGTDLRIEGGTVTLTFTNTPDLRIGGIDTVLENIDGDLSLNLQGRSDLTGELDLSAKADIAAMQASGQITLTDMNVRPLLVHAVLPDGITSEDTRATVKANFAVTGPETLQSRFDLRFPSLTVRNKDRKLNLETVAISGAVDYADKSLSVSIDTLRSVQPALELSAAAIIKPASDTGRSVMELRAAVKQLDVAIASVATRAIAGGLNDIQTVFSIAKEGQVTDATYFAGFETDSNGWQLTGMKASGHLTRGRVTIPGIDADLERMDGDVVYRDKHVEFKNVSGHFKGATVKGLNAAIDWEEESTLTISSPSVVVDVAPMFTWLTGFKGLNKAKNEVETATGTARVTGLEISGPLTEPNKWVFKITGSPEKVITKGPRAPFEIKFSGGEFTYTPGKEQATDVRIDFLDGFLVASYRAKGIIHKESSVWRIDGSMGQAAIDWVGTVLPIPKHLQLKPPVDLKDANILLTDTDTFSFTGGLKTAGGLDVFADFTVAPQDWHLRRIQFADGSSQLTASASKHTDGIEMRFSGDVEQSTADRLLENNQVLSGRIQGEFQAVIDTRELLNSSFTGKLAGEGLQIIDLFPEPVDLKQFSIEGNDGKVTIAPSTVSLRNSLLIVDGVVDHRQGGLTFDLNVDADRLDEELIRALHPMGKDKADVTEKSASPSVVVPRGAVHVQAADFTYAGFTWSRVRADVRIDGSDTDVQVHQANLCGISTPGTLAFSPRGMRLNITPTATDASLQGTVDCLWHRPVIAKAKYDLAGEINLPPTQEDPIQFMSGRMEISSENGRVEAGYVLMEIISVLNVTEAFTGGKSDLAENGYGYTKAYAKTEIGGGKLLFNEILIDGHSLKITGQGTIDLKDQTVDIILLAAPLKTVDRIINKIPVIGYILGGSLISVPLRIEGKLGDLSVVPIPPSAVGKGLIGIMERTLKAPFKLVESTAGLVSKDSAVTKAAPDAITLKDH